MTAVTGLPVTPVTLWYKHDSQKDDWVYNHLEKGHVVAPQPKPKCGQRWGGAWEYKHVWLTDHLPAKVVWISPEEASELEAL